MIIPDLPDRDARQAAIRERHRNVVIDAGAGTGKTGLLVRRVTELTAPRDESIPPIPIGRIAAITFTRRAAGELSLRIRQALLSALSASTDPVHRSRLRAALEGLDGACIGTIHSFADRVLRPFSASAGLAPFFEVVEDTAPLVDETVDLLLRGLRDGSLHDRLDPMVDEILVQEAGPTLRDFPRCGLLLETKETPRYERFGFDSLVEAFLMTRDVPPRAPAFPEFEPSTFRRHLRELLERIEPIAHLDGAGIELLRRIGETARRLEREEDPVVLYAAFGRPLGRREPLGRPHRKIDLAGDDAAWEAWGAIFGSSRKDPPRTPPLREDLLAPLRRWLAHRIVRLAPVACGAYASVQRHRGAIDPLDLLLALGDLLRRDPAARSAIRRRFTHVLVDEFQDTDPLQARILLDLAQDPERPGRLRDGALTLVGDPKQSIYRFRRADIAAYEETTRCIETDGATRLTLSANLRSDPALVRWVDSRFSRILGAPPDATTRFDTRTGRAFHQSLQAGRRAPGEGPRVHVIPIEPIGTNADDYRRLEADALAHYVRWLVTRSGETIAVSASTRRPIRYSDIAILASVTTNVHLLSQPFDAHDIPHTVGGGRLFLQDELHRRFILGLRALADRDDGVAEAALLAPPFFALDPADILRERRLRRESPDERPDSIAPVREALETIADLRRRRLHRSPGETARDLLERSAIGRVTALGPNGPQRLRSLREICFALERTASAEHLDYDGATAVFRRWIDRPAQLDPPPHIDADAVRILTVHQAKGLEFPAVVLWDCRGTLQPRNDRPVWITRDSGNAWAIALEGLSFEEPARTGLVARDRVLQASERERLLYVAATRARDLLVVPCDGEPGADPPGALATNRHLLRGSAPDDILVLPAFREAHPPDWASASVVLPESRPEDAGDEDLADALSRSVVPHLAPRAISVVAWERAGRLPPDETWIETELTEEREHRSRFGSTFGTVVHRALALALVHALTPREAVRRAANRLGMGARRSEAEADVRRTLEALLAIGIRAGDTDSTRLEYPVAGRTEDGRHLLVGVIDLLFAGANAWLLIDFKTDATEGADADSFRPYQEQIRLYGSLLAPDVPDGIPLRLGLLFTETGETRWLPGAVVVR